MRCISIALAATIFAAWVSAAQADVFVGTVDKERITLACDGPGVVETPCRIGIGSSRSAPVRFTNRPTRYAHLLKQGIEKALKGDLSFRPDASDISLLRGL